MPAGSEDLPMYAARPVRRLLVAVVGLASLATVLLPGGYVDPLVKRVGGAIVQPVPAAPLDCAMGDMADMQMPMSMDCASR
jgi:hypothetical protein